MDNTLTINYGANIAIEEESKSPYDPEFVNIVQESQQEYKKGNYTVVDDIKNLWNILDDTNDETGIKLKGKR